MNAEPLPPASERVEQLYRWSLDNLRVPYGLLQGEPYRIEDWQLRWLTEALESNTREAFLCVARKNGKTGMIAAMMLCYLVGPWVRRDWRGVVTSLTGQLAKELRGQMESTAVASGLLYVGSPLRFLKSPTPGRALGKQRSSVDFLAADKATGHAVGADLALIDEAGLLPEAKRDLWNALLSCISGRNGRFWSVSIQGDGPMLAEQISRHAEGDPGVYGKLYAAPPSAALDDKDAWAAANPGLGTIKAYDYMQDVARRAVNSPADQSAFRAFELNQKLDPARIMVVSLADWQESCAQFVPPRAGDCYLGIDLGTSQSMTCAVAYWPESYRAEVYGALPGLPDPLTRGRSDGVGSLYVTMSEAGELSLYDGQIVTPVAPFMLDVAEKVGPVRAVGADGHRKAEIAQMLLSTGLRWRIVPRGTGATSNQTASHDIRAFQRAVLRKRFVPTTRLLLEHAISDSAVVSDPSGHLKLDKTRTRGRIDALQAAVIAAGLAESHCKRRSRMTIAHRSA